MTYDNFAFPCVAGTPQDGHLQEGMTLREYFASSAPITFRDAMEDINVKNIRDCEFKDAVYDRLVSMRLRYADKMLARTRSEK